MKSILKLKQDKGTAGLTILLSLVVMLFVIGLIVMIFTLMSGALSTASFTSTTGSVSNETLTTVDEIGENFANAGLRGVTCTLDASKVYNSTDGVVIGSGNYTLTNCNIKAKTAGSFNNTNWKVTYTYTYSADNSATNTINSTGQAVAGVVTYFPLFITIGAMVVLILLTVIIITAIKSSGLVGGEVAGQRSVGTA